MKNNILSKVLMAIVMIAVALAVSMPLGLRGTGVVSAEEGDITVRILLYSGRPDPTFVIKEKDLVEKIRANITGAAMVEGFKKDSVIPAVLGYKGILMDNPSKQSGLPAHLAVYKGVMEVQDGKKRFLADKDESLEKMLLDEAIRRGVIDEVIIKRMREGQ